MHILYR